MQVQQNGLFLPICSSGCLYFQGHFTELIYVLDLC